MEKKKVCKYCKNEINNGAKICPSCGKKQKMSIWKIVLIILAALFILGLLFGGSDEPTSSTTSNNSSSKTESKKEFNMNETVTYKGVDYTVTNVEKSYGSDFDKPAAGKEFVIVHLKIENKSSKKISYNALDWKMQNSQGQEESETFTTIDNDISLNSGDLIPGGVKEGTVVFEESIDDNGLKLAYYSNIFSDEAQFYILLTN